MTMNLRLYLMRHAEAEIDRTKKDFDRHLTNYGIIQSGKAGFFLNNFIVDKAVVSYAKRTMQTYNLIQQEITEPEVEVLMELYKGNEEGIIDMLCMQDDRNKHLLVIGHNPTIHSVAEILADPSSPKYEYLVESSMPPAQIVVLDFHEIHSWEHLREEKAKIFDIFTNN